LNDVEAWPLHVKGCKHCSGVIYLLKARAREPEKIYELLNKAQAKASTTNRSHHPSPLSQAWSFFSFGQPKWAVPALATSLILLFVGWGINNRYVLPKENGAVVTSLNEDLYGNTTDWLKVAVAKLNDENLALQEKRREVESLSKNAPQIKAKIASLKIEELPSKERADLANLVAEYNTGIADLNHKLAEQKNSREVQTLKITPTADSEMVVRVYTTAYNSTAKKDAEGEKEPPTQAETVKAIRVGKKEVDVVAINAKEVIVRDLKPDRNLAETQALRQSLTDSLSQKQMSVKLSKTGHTEAATPDNSLAPDQ
jgi:hypothetical protein